jgi:hypothetical protein
MAFIIEQAGGTASTGKIPILDIGMYGFSVLSTGLHITCIHIKNMKRGRGKNEENEEGKIMGNVR